MAGKLFRPGVWTRQPQYPVPLSGNALTRGISFAAPLSAADSGRDVVGAQRATRTGNRSITVNRAGAFETFGTSQFLDFTKKPVGLTTTTPATISWVQDPRSTSAYGALMCLQVGSPGTDSQFVIYQAAADSTYYFTAGTRQANGAQKWSTAVGPLTNNQLDVFVLIANKGLSSITAGDWTLYRNGALVPQDANATYGLNTTDAFRIGALETGTDVFEGAIGNLVIWNRALTGAEARAMSGNPWQIWQAPELPLFSGAAGAGGSTGTLATTNANDTSAASGTTTVVGTLAKTNANDSSAASGTTTIKGTVAYTNANDSVSASGSGGTSVAVGGYYGDEPKPRRFVQKVGNKFHVFTDATKALNAAIAADKAAEVDKEVDKDTVEVDRAPVEKPTPDAIVPVADVRAVATSFGHQAKLNDLFTAKNYDQIVALYEELVQQDEEDIELLLMSM